jgi:hypothetical protein
LNDEVRKEGATSKRRSEEASFAAISEVELENVRGEREVIFF